MAFNSGPSPPTAPSITYKRERRPEDGVGAVHAWLGSVNEAKRRDLTPEQCAELLGR